MYKDDVKNQIDNLCAHIGVPSIFIEDYNLDDMKRFLVEL